MLEDIIRSSLAWLYSLRAPYQRYFIFNLPGYNSNLIRDEDQKNSGAIEELYTLFRNLFSEIAEESGFLLIDHQDAFETKQLEHLIDHAHFHPKFYEKIFDGFSF
jgi:hypothetical protein